MAQPKRQHDLYAELAALPANRVGEIIHGVLHAHPRPARQHGRAASELGMELGNPFRRGRGGPGGWVFIDEHELHLGEHVVVPDISGWRVERYPAHETTPFTTIAPDWICEVASPSTQRLDRVQKLPIYAQHGVKHCWYIDPIDRTLEVFILDDAGSYKVGPTFVDDAAVTAPPFEVHTFSLANLWDEPITPPAT
jgi:Uma2 family endonuclease